MYTVINRTNKTSTDYIGNFPYDELVDLLESDNDIIVVCEHSSTIKIPYLDMDSNNHGQTKSSKDWLFKDYDYNPYLTQARMIMCNSTQNLKMSYQD